MFHSQPPPFSVKTQKEAAEICCTKGCLSLNIFFVSHPRSCQRSTNSSKIPGEVRAQPTFTEHERTEAVVPDLTKKKKKRKKEKGWSTAITGTLHFSSHHSFSLRTCSSSLGVKSFLMLNCLRISSGVLPLIMLATVLHVTSSSPLMSR